MKLNAKKDAQLDYLRRQLDQAMKNNRKEIQRFDSSSESKARMERAEEELSESSEEQVRRPRRTGQSKQQSMDLKVKIPKFEGQLNPDDFLDWLSTVEQVFEYKDILDNKKVKLVALKCCRYASIWSNNVLSK